MDIAALSVVMHNSNIRQAATTAVLGKVMDISKMQMENTLEMSLEPYLGTHVDIRI